MNERSIEVRLRQMIRELDALARRKNGPPPGMCPPPMEDAPPDMPFPPPPGIPPADAPFPPHAEDEVPRAHSPGMGRLLGLLCDTDGTPQIELARAMRIRPQSLSELLCRMEQKGYVVRTPSESDKRQTIVHITDSGREKAAEMRKIHERAAAALFAPLTNAEKETLAALLQKVIAAGESADPE